MSVSLRKICLLVSMCAVLTAPAFGRDAHHTEDPGAAENRPSAHYQAPAPELLFPGDREVVEVPFRLELNKIIVPVTVNGVGPFDFVLDTGASHALLHVAEPPPGLELRIIGQSLLHGAGEEESETLDLAGTVTFGLGEVLLRNNQMAVASAGSKILRHMGDAWQGILGRQVFDNLVVEIDWIRERLRLHHPERFTPEAGDVAFALELSHGHAFIEGRVVIDEVARPTRFVLDTGAYHALSLAGEQRPSRRLRNVMLGRGLNGKIHGDVARIRRLELGPFSFDDLVADFPQADLLPVLTSGSDGNLGSEVLRRFTTTFDYSRQRLWLRPNRNFDQPFTFSTSGLRLRSHRSDGDRVDIDDVYPGSPAEKAGITAQDRLVAIDGEAVRNLGFDLLRRALEAEPGSELVLDLERGGEVREVRLRLEKLL